MPDEKEIFLGIEGGGTRTTAIFARRGLQILARSEFGPGNVRLLNDEGLLKLFDRVSSIGPLPAAVGIGLAGTRDEKDRLRIRAAAEKVWGKIPVVVTHDLEIALNSAEHPTGAVARVLVLSGTGSCCYGTNAEGKTAKVGGWGHLLGDLGSGYDISLQAIKAAIFAFDRHDRWGALGKSILRAAQLNSPHDLIHWAQTADKPAIARIAPTVFEAARRDPLARDVIQTAAKQLARDAVLCAERLATNGDPVSFVLAGNVLRRQPAVASKVAGFIRTVFPKASVQTLSGEGAIGAVKLAMEAARTGSGVLVPAGKRRAKTIYVPTFVPAESPTEQRNPNSMRLSESSIESVIDLMLDSEAGVIPALRREKRQIERVVNLASKALQRGGRIFYVGAGTSGRLGVLDASECPPTFRVSPEIVQGIIAGGPTALWQAAEGAEDDWNAGASAMHFRSAGPKDIVIGIAASGRTPFVWGALWEAHRKRSVTVLICFNPALKIESQNKPDVVIAPDLGPEILTGSTRLKCGTATKLILNMISTISMVRLGKTISNLMVDLNPSNVKLRDRAVRIVQELTGCKAEHARAALEKSGWAVKNAWRALQRSSKVSR